METSLRRLLLTAMLVACISTLSSGGDPLSDQERKSIETGLQELNQRLIMLRSTEDGRPSTEPDAVADAEIFAKGVTWALRYEERLASADLALARKALERGQERVKALQAGKQPWAEKKGRVVRGFVSAVDGSVQPYGLILPAKYDRGQPLRLDVVLHGSTRPAGMSELRFLNRFDEGDAGNPKNVPDQDFMELHPLGRVENCYRWAGETDVFEAIEAVCRHYAVDRERMVLRGMSMGASGTWHLGLKHPDRFVALGPYCGYVDTHRFSETPQPNFVKVGPLPPHQEKTLHMLDSIDYAANAGIVPAIACMGEKDVFFQAHVLMGQAMEREGLKMINLISPGTGHVQDPVTHKEQMRQIQQHAAKGLDHAPRHIRFVTWTLKYSRCHWLQILGLEEHYTRAELEARLTAEGGIEVAEPKNITRFAIGPPVLEPAVRRIRIGSKEISLPARENESTARNAVFGKRDGAWVYVGERDRVMREGKGPGQQGPIDDAFTTPFLCVRGTGTAWNPGVQAWAEASLRRFAYEWHRYFRGDLPIKDDTAVTEEDVRRCNLILFGDPGSNLWMRRVLPHLPIQWTRNRLEIGKQQYAAADHVPLLIQPNPLVSSLGGPSEQKALQGMGRYIVFNSGHTIHEKELASLNYLLFPRLGDWAVVRVGGKAQASAVNVLDEEVIKAGFFDEQWGLSDARSEKRPD